MKLQTYIAMIAVVAMSCGQRNENETGSASQDSTFSNYKEALVLRFWEMYPTWASSVGYHKYDDVLKVPNEEQRKTELAFVNAELDSLKKYDIKKLNDNNRTDYYLIENQLNSAVWGVEKMKSYEWDPSSYNLGSLFGDMLNNTYDKLDVRLRNFYKRMENIPAFYEAARQNIKNPTLEHTQLAIEQNLGSISVFEKGLEDSIAASGLSAEEKTQFGERTKKTIAAI